MTRGPSMLKVLKIGDFRRYYIGYTASAFGDTLTPFALAFAVLQLTGSPSALGVVVLSTRLPIIVFALVGGAIGDRFSRRTIMLATDAIRFAVQAGTAAILLTGVAQVWMLVGLQLVAGAGAAFFNPAAQGLITSVVDKPNLRQANSLLAVSRSATSILAVGSAGVLVALAAPGWAIGVDALTFLVSAIALSRLPRSFTAEHRRHRQPRRWVPRMRFPAVEALDAAGRQDDPIVAGEGGRRRAGEFSGGQRRRPLAWQRGRDEGADELLRRVGQRHAGHGDHRPYLGAIAFSTG